MARRLTTIVMTDVVGYSRLMAADETGTLAAVRAHQKQVIKPLIARCGGRVVKLMGDGSMLEFASVVDAVRFAVLMQRAVAADRADIVYRIGVNIGDVIVEDDDIFGDGINIAARLEPLADPGGICISHSVHSQIQGKIDLDFEAMGPVQVKNIPKPIEAWRVLMNDKAAVIEQPEVVAPVVEGSRWIAAAAVAAALVALGGGYLSFSQSGSNEATINTGREIAESSLIVLPFDDYSGGESLDYFADGITEDLITDLARWPELRVTSRNSSNLYKGKAVDVREVAREMGVRYVLEGSVRRVGEQMRITAQLIDGQSGEHVWAERFQEIGSDILGQQDRIITKIVQSLIGSYGMIRKDEYAKTWARADVELEEYDYYLRGHKFFYQYDEEGFARAKAIWSEGLEKYPNSGLLKIKLGWWHLIQVMDGYSQDRQLDIEKADELLRTGMADAKLPPAGHRAGIWLDRKLSAVTGNFDEVLRISKIIADAYPNDSELLMFNAVDVALAGDVDLADRWMTWALELGADPKNYGFEIGTIRFMQGRYEVSIQAWVDWFDGPNRTWYLAASNAALGRMDKATAYADRLRKEFPEITPEIIRLSGPWRDQAVPDRLLELLAEAGWPGPDA